MLKKKGSLKKTILSIFLWHLLPKSRSWGVKSGRGLSPLYHINIEQIFQSWKIQNFPSHSCWSRRDKHFILLQHHDSSKPSWRKLLLKIFGNFHNICARLACNNPSRKGLKFLSVFLHWKKYIYPGGKMATIYPSLILLLSKFWTL